MHQSFAELDINAYQPYQPDGVQARRLFDHEELRADLVVLPPHTAVPPHSHAHAHELFDVIEGQGDFSVDGVEFPGYPGKCVFVKAGTVHALRNDSDQPWTVRVTYQRRIYARHVGMLLGRAIRKRLKLTE